MDVINTNKEPIAIIGIGCRFPGGASNPDKFWQMLCNGQDAIVEVPKDRWDARRFYDPDPDKPGKTYVNQGGFLKEKIDGFDPLFFGISPREAESMDPQQRLLLEVTWEAFENAGLTAEELTGSKTGVFIGGFCLDNLLVKFGPLNRELADSHTAASSTMTILSNRISHVFDLSGPSVSMDTACSSSLVTTHFACNSIWQGESDMAIAGGVNVMLRPEQNILMSKGHFLSEHGRCMAFDERAAGYTRGEGAGAVLLKPLSAALENHDRIYALIKMTGVNQDGHTPGISMPNADAQAALMRSVYKKAGITPGDVGYVEAHGTGTQAGDPKEAQALDTVLSEGRHPGQKCLIGSVKTNIGHLEAGAGVAGLIKATLCVQHGKIPPSLHFKNPNPNIPFDRMCIRVVTQVEDWPEGYGTRYAGVNSFGYGGTNAHVLLQEPPAPVVEDNAKYENWNKPYLLPVSARSDNALTALAGKYAFYLTSHGDPKSVADFFYTAVYRRSHHRYRLALLADSAHDLREKLQRFNNSESLEGLITGEMDSNNPEGLVFIYTGMGPQWWAMGRELMEKEPVFFETIRECDRYFVKEAGWSILEALQAGETDSQMAKTEVAQPANFAIQIALTALWESWNIKPDAVIGHSVGEVASAYVSGALSLEEAIKVSFHRSRLQATTAGQGAMLAAGLPETDAFNSLKAFDQVSIAAINSPASVTLSGDETQLKELAAKLQEQNIFNRFLQVEVAYHSHQMDPIEDELRKTLSSLKPHPTRVPLYSTVTGELIDGTEIGSDYWWRNVRDPVRFAHGIRTLLNAGFKNFVEIGPHPVLGHSVKEIAANEQISVSLVPSLNRKSPEQKRMLESLGQLYTLGYSVNWKKVIPGNGRFTTLPSYPWQKEHYWREASESVQDRLGLDGHSFLNNKLPSPRPAWFVEINRQFFPFLEDHCINGEVVFPGAAYVEAGLAVHNLINVESNPKVLTDIEFHTMLFVEPKRIQLLGIDYDATKKEFNIYSRFKEDDSEWKHHSKGKLLLGKFSPPETRIEISSLRQRIYNDQPVATLYNSLAARGLEYGPQFQTVRKIWTGDNEVLVELGTDPGGTQPKNRYYLDPAILDGAFHAVLSLFPGNTLYVPVSISSLFFYDSPGLSCLCHAVIIENSKDTLRIDFSLFDKDGGLFIKIQGCTFKKIDTHADSSIEQYFYKTAWVPYQSSDLDINGDIHSCLLFSNDDPFSLGLERHLSSSNIVCTKAVQGKSNMKLNNNSFELEINNKDSFDYLFSNINGRDISHVIYLWPLSQDTAAPDADEITAQCMKLIHIVQQLANLGDREINLIIVTRTAQAVTNDEPNINLNFSPLWGLGHLIENEHGHIRCRNIDIDTIIDSGKDKGFLSLMLGSKANDMAIRNGNIFIKKLLPINSDKNEPQHELVKIPTTEPVALKEFTAGKLESLSYMRVQRYEPEDDEVEIKVHYCALNYKDVLKVFGYLPEKIMEGTFLSKSIGIEVGGIITKKGKNVTRFSTGDEVIAYAAGGFRSFVNTLERFVIKKPSNLKLEESLNFINYITAYYGLIDIARLANGEKVLIHNAAGGVGLAAVNIAKRAGAEIYATAGSDEKREYLRTLGIKNVYNSRTLDFFNGILSDSEQAGVDVVLNSLTGESLALSLELLAPYGRFVEIGKQDIINNNTISMSVFNRNISFTAIDIDRMGLEKPNLINQFSTLISGKLSQGEYPPLPVTVFSASDISDAFRHMAQAKHIGKVIIKFDQEHVNVEEQKEDFSYTTAEDIYLITGGSSGFGLEVAKWLINKGIKNLVLISRHGVKSEQDRALLTSFQKDGATIEEQLIDIADFDSCCSMINYIKERGYAIKGIIHAATVYDDALLINIDSRRFSDVIRPKVQGALNLYRCTKSENIKFFVMFSSISSLIGNTGQANYVAANTFLDEFSYVLRKKNFPAFAINWGALAEVGILKRNAEVSALLEKEGINSLATTTALKALENILFSNHHHISVLDVNWERWFKVNPSAEKSTRFSDLVKRYNDGNASGAYNKIQEIIDRVESLTPSEQLEYIQSVLREGLAKVLKLTPNKIDLNQDLNKLGIDSLMVIELSLEIRTEFGIDISSVELLKHPTITELSKIINHKFLEFSINQDANHRDKQYRSSSVTSE